MEAVCSLLVKGALVANFAINAGNTNPDGKPIPDHQVCVGAAIVQTASSPVNTVTEFRLSKDNVTGETGTITRVADHANGNISLIFNVVGQANTERQIHPSVLPALSERRDRHTTLLSGPRN